MPQADYCPNGNNSACDTIRSPLSTFYSQLTLDIAGRIGFGIIISV
ncbi:MAG: hypothetical protein LBE12_04460 [Planctomycetaceae bacterium]|nr:hypothetical protein [Planctomycetaceae bacterium]